MTNEEATKALPADERQAFTLRKVYAYTSADIAVVMDLTPLKVDALLAKAALHFADAVGRTA